MGKGLGLVVLVLAVAMGLGGCSVLGLGAAEPRTACRPAVSAGGVPLQVCQKGGALTVLASHDVGELSDAVLDEAVRTAVDVRDLPRGVAPGRAPRAVTPTVDACETTPSAGETRMVCRLTLVLAH